jgi:hypothetical protein
MAANPEIIYGCDSRESPFSLKKEDRRIYFREKVLLSDLQLEDGNRGIVLDISEQGLAMQSAQTLNRELNPRLRFQLSQSTKWIEVEGKLAWISPSRYAAGIEFTDLSYDALIAIKTWMFEIASLGAEEDLEIDLSDAAHPQLATDSDEPASKSDETEPIAQTAEYLILGDTFDEGTKGAVVNEEKLDFKSQFLSENLPLAEIAVERCRSEPKFLPKPLLGTGRSAAAKWPVNIALTMWTAILAAFLIFGWHRRIENSRPPERITAGQRAGNASLEPTSMAVRAGSPAGNATTSPDDFGFVLQVAAMQSESSALAIADVFRAKNLSVFVMKPAGGNLYLVLIGPYGDRASAVIARTELKSKGFDAIQKRTSSLQ